MCILSVLFSIYTGDCLPFIDKVLGGKVKECSMRHNRIFHITKVLVHNYATESLSIPMKLSICGSSAHLVIYILHKFIQ